MTVDDRRAATLSVRQAAFIGVGAMVGAGIPLCSAQGRGGRCGRLALFLFAGAIAGLAKVASSRRFGVLPVSAGRWAARVRRQRVRQRTRHRRHRLAATGCERIITGMVAVSFGSYASAAFADGGTAWTKAFAVLVVFVMTVLNILGSQAVAKRMIVVIVVISILTLFAVATLTNLDPELLAFRLPARATSCRVSR